MLQHPGYTRNRIRQLVDRLQGRIYRDTVEVEDLQIAGPVDRIPYEEAQQLNYEPVQLGQQLGPAWATFWVRGSVRVPADWAGQRVDLLWKSHSEATLWLDGRTVGGLNSGRNEVVLVKEAAGGETATFQVEVACNELFGQQGQHYDSIEPYVLDRVGIGRFDPVAWELYYDMLVLSELEREQDLSGDWKGRLLAELNRAANILDEEDASTWSDALAILKDLYKVGNGGYVHALSAIGHAHIDTAWLWPIGETWRKCMRTFSTALLYMEDYPEYKFSCPQAAQYEAMQERNPELYRRMAEKVRTGQWVPVGGTWIEPDCNVPSGEALNRQFLYGQRFFQKEFGITCREFWNPDVFGYNGQLPQIMRQAGITRFLTQKLSWNAFNKPDHQTFMWQGIDGSEVVTHFPPANTYNAVATVEQLRHNVNVYKDSDRSGQSLLLYGIGDGGGGPTRDMLERIRRAEDLQGLPQTTNRNTEEFWDQLEAGFTDRPVRVGELYFELHRGTYTTQAATKKGNRKGEFLLHDIEFAATVANRLHGTAYPKDELDVLWKLLLTNQFHDILPGSSITLVYEDAERDYAQIQQEGGELRAAAIAALGEGVAKPLNTTGFDRAEVVENTSGELVYAQAPAYGVGTIGAPPDQVVVTESGATITLANDRVAAVLAADGTLTSLVEKASGRQVMAEPGNQFLTYVDKPTAWDAWDIDPWALETVKTGAGAESCEILTRSPLRGEVAFTHKVGKKSSFKQVVRLDAGSGRLEFHTEVDWQEDDTMLKVAFPVQVRSMEATYEMQFGHTSRPTHYNTMHDLARYEVPGHKWVDLSEHGFGVSLLSESKYGYHTFDNTMHITLLRAPKKPDPIADRGQHTFSYAIYPHQGSWQEAGVIAEGFSFNVPLQWTGADATSWFRSDDAGLILDTVKRAEDSESLVLRLYEAYGGRGTARVKIGLPFEAAVSCNTLEEEGAPLVVQGDEIIVPYRPHQVISILVK
ncbi:MAG: alpha-mannosidase [Gemmatimonadetes bacterium]|jgi:alpha-mannosidase|nr:alpha-mannosidase [Gemmatimonadota bacterium]MBT5141364.1 alpha-mannosidase [Gemmatimonadota bacterium]MBT5590445.1 alpha-mannosidase [Gemmatimonadota bacterium]MBT5964282.1 alpha-mannosidase [Gemmatimonadota bacterium]MBT6628179.1 alpha-mannosidase [Gemmatimonadota bacterium]